MVLLLCQIDLTYLTHEFSMQPGDTP
jgi:hypothetical protein